QRADAAGADHGAGHLADPGRPRVEDRRHRRHPPDAAGVLRGVLLPARGMARPAALDRHRDPGGPRGRRMTVTTHLNRRTGLTVLLAVCLVALSLVIQMAKPSKAQNQFAPSFKHVGAVGQPIEMREGTVTVTKLRLAKRLESRGLRDKKVETTGYWLLVDYNFVPLRESEPMTMDLYTADNTKYIASLRPDG